MSCRIGRRRLLLAAVATGCMPGHVRAQSKGPRVGMIGPRPLADGIVQPPVIRRLAELGYRDGAGMVLEYRVTGGRAARAREIARELLDLKCDLIFAFEEPAIRALHEARAPTPVVFFAVDFDPVESGLIKSPRRTEANMTGIYGPIAGLAAKKVELALEVLPGARHFLVLSDVQSKHQLQALRVAAEKRGASLTVVEFAQPPYDLAAAFETGRQAGVNAFLGVSSPVFGGKRAELGALFIKHRMPAFAARLSSVEPGFLTAGPTYNLNKMARRTAELGVRVLNGTRASEIPVEQGDEFELILNLKTAKTLGIKFPYSVLARATSIVE